MENKAIRFACNGCGICCKGRLVPLTLNETRQWLERGHDVAILLEAFAEFTWTSNSQQFDHAARRAVEVQCGDTSVHVIAVFAGNARVKCQNLGDDGRCGIYEERPLVCRIYPMEINPFIALDPANKICPPEVWEDGQILFTDRIVDPVLADQVERSRQADRDDAQVKIALCQALGLNVAAWKGDALAVYLPDRTQLSAAIDGYDDGTLAMGDCNWKVRADASALRQRLDKTGIAFDDLPSDAYIFHTL